ncbi:hypothetical protein DMH04_48050 [Kibdelosporangium aridum]|uniref:Guanylate cyclase domain-containing protein n=1 Tax=Kibdelosporangium aridum TaxID=2030 RepID=A0A428YJP1_KIBAR|nr:hypothetical protein DMH04_48050 [Kibdelosporangium aridum]
MDGIGQAGAAPSTAKKVKPRTGQVLCQDDITLMTAHRIVIAVDIVGFGEHSRNNINQVRVRHGMYRAMQDAFDFARIPWHDCHREDRGDGVLLLAHANVQKAFFVDRLPNALVGALVTHNRVHPPEEKMRLRLALHAGEVNYDDHGVTGSAITHTFRLLEARAVRDATTTSSAVLAIIGSAWFYDEVIRHSELSQFKAYRRVDIFNKETSTRAWIRLLRRPTTVRREPTSSIPRQKLDD